MIMFFTDDIDLQAHIMWLIVNNMKLLEVNNQFLFIQLIRGLFFTTSLHMFQLSIYGKYVYK